MADAPFDPERGAVVGEREAGAPRRLVGPLRAALLELLEQGVYRKHACAGLEVSVETLRNEMKRNPEFKAAVLAAEAKATIDASKCVTTNAATDPKIALEYLGRKHPKEWGKKKGKPAGLPSVGTSKREIIAELVAKLVGDAPPPAPAAVPEPEPGG